MQASRKIRTVNFERQWNEEKHTNDIKRSSNATAGHVKKCWANFSLHAVCTYSEMMCAW